MTEPELTKYLHDHPDMQMCPNCGGAGERVFPVRGKVIECETCRGAGVVPKG
jgi:DnaJ-class molecular chaperone